VVDAAAVTVVAVTVVDVVRIVERMSSWKESLERR